MPRAARVVIPGTAHHLMQRGVDHQVVFHDDEDFSVYLKILRKKAGKYGFEILGYCLMSDHVHLVGTPNKPSSLAKAFGRTNYSYSFYFNEKYRASGRLWQNRFSSCPLDADHFWRALCYIERNPVRAGIVEAAWRYNWSSAAAHVGEDSLDEIIDVPRWQRISEGIAWRTRLSRPDEAQTVSAIRRSTSTGRPLGGDPFIDSLEKKTGRRLRARPVGRPRRSM